MDPRSVQIAALGHQRLNQVQSIQVPIIWKKSDGINVDANIEVVPVVSKQSLKCMKYYTPSETKVMMCVGRSFFPNHNDVKLTGKSRQGVGEGGYVLWQLDYMSTVGILSVW